MRKNIENNGINLKLFELSKVDYEWYKESYCDTLLMVDPFNDFLTRMMREDSRGFGRLHSSHLEEYKKLLGNPQFTFQGRSEYKVWAFKLSSEEHLLLISSSSGTTFEYAGFPTPTEVAFTKACSILISIKDELVKYPRDKNYDHVIP